MRRRLTALFVAAGIAVAALVGGVAVEGAASGGTSPVAHGSSWG